MVRLRRQIHRTPELALQEFETAKLIVETLRSAGFEEVYTGLAKTGVVAVLRGESDESILLRADMDGLPVQETNQHEFASNVKSRMHACGHDGHVSILLRVAISTIEATRKNGLVLKKGIKFCFQPGEESANGAQLMIKDTGVYNMLETSPRVTHCYGLHLASAYRLGEIHYRTGPVSANSERWEIHIQGKGGHSKSPELTIDSIQVGAQIISAIYQIKGRNVNQTTASTVSVGMFDSGEAPNIVNERALIKGSTRSMHSEDRDEIFNRLQKICKGAEIQHDCKVEFIYVSGYHSVVNHESLAPQVERVISKVATLKHGTLGLGGEDFYNFCEARPSAFVMIGAALEDGLDQTGKNLRPHHSPLFDFDERALMHGYNFFMELIRDINS